MILDLCGRWLMRDLTLGGEWTDAEVPSCNYTDLLKANKIPDPFLGMNENETAVLGDRDWEYKRTFEADDELLCAPRAELCCDMLDTVFRIYINGKEVLSDCNSFIGYRVDIKGALKKGTNEISVIFSAPRPYAEKEMKRLNVSASTTGLQSVTFIRKAQCHFGWDWGPVVPVSGITKAIYIDYGGVTRIADLYVEQRHSSGKVTLCANAEITGGYQTEYTLTVKAPDGAETAKKGIASGSFAREFEINDPVLWWCADLDGGKRQQLYTVTLTAVDESGARIERSVKVGLRTIELDRSEDEFGRNFRFLVNGVPIFAKGANWIPADSMPDRVDEARLKYLLDAAVRAGFNMIRVWGGGFYESDEFYAMCDERGILVWQDFMFACRPYPLYDKEFVKNALREVEYNVKRLRNHPSLALWCGNNEIESDVAMLMLHKKYSAGEAKFFWETLEKGISKFDEHTPYTAGTPIGVAFNKGVAADNVGDTHLWAVWHGLQNVKYYRKRYTRFCSEFGFESLPDLKTVKTFSCGAPFDIYSDLFLQHQKCIGGNAKTEYYVASRFRLPKDPIDIVYLSQACQAESIKDATEFWRRNRPRTNGALYWQLNDCWPVASWSSIDYYGNYKALQYQARHFNAPIAVSLEDGKDGVKIYVINDTLVAKDAEVRFAFADFEKGVLHSETVKCRAEAVSVSVIKELGADVIAKCDRKRTVLVAELYANGELLNRKTLIFLPEKKLALPKVKVKLASRREGDKIAVELLSPAFARIVCVSNSVSTLPLNDNWFDMLPGEKVTLTMPYYDGYSPDDFSVKSVADVEPAGCALKDNLKRLAVFLKPVNLAQWIYYRQGKFEYKE